MIAAAHLTPGMAYMDVPSDAPGFYDGGIQGRVRVTNVRPGADRGYPDHVQVYVEDETDMDWYRMFDPTRLIDVT